MSEIRRSKSLKRELSDEILATVIDSNTGNTYRTGKFLGKGGFAKVHEIINLENNVTYAAKIIPKAKVTKKYQITKVAREIMLHRDLVHKNVVTLESYFEDIDHVYIILENCPNQSLVHLMKKQICFSLHDTKYYVSQLIAGTKYIHSKNIIHRDLKPGNMFLSANMTVKIGDFGLAVTASSITGPVMLCGTPNYIAPEVLSKTNVSYKIDVWAIGCTIYCLLFGVPPYESSTLEETYRRIESNIWNKNKVKGDFQLLDLLEGILKTDYNERLSISDIERHPFFTDNPNDLTLEQIDLNYNEEDTNPELLQNTLRTNSDQEIYNKINDAILTKALTLDSKIQKTSVNRGISFKRIMQNLFQRKKVISSKSNSGDKNDSMTCDDDKSNVQNNERDIMIKYELTNKRGGGAQISNSHNKLTNCFDQKNSHSLPYGYQHNNIKSNEILLRVIEKICDRTKSSCQNVHYMLGLNVIFVSKWIDYSNKYGFGYQLTNNTTGVLFNDNTTMTVSAKDNNKSVVQYVDYSGTMTSYHASEIPNNLREKHTYTLYFREYMERKLTDGAASPADMWLDHNSYSDKQNITVKRWIRTSGEIIMELSNGTVQVNFLMDHSKMVLSFIPPEMWQNITLIAKTSKPFILPVEKPQDPQTYDINSVALTYINSNRQLVHFRAIDLNYPWSKTVEPLIGRLNYVRLVLEEFSRLD